MAFFSTKNDKRIILLSRCPIAFSSYFVLGFQEFCAANFIGLDIRSEGSPQEFSAFIASGGGKGPASVMFVMYVTSEKQILAAIDISDSADPAFNNSYNRDVLSLVDIYFKVNINRNLLDSDPALKQDSSKILDVPFFFAIRPKAYTDVFFANPLGDGMTGCLRGVADTLLNFRTMMPPSFFEKVGAQKKIRDFTFFVTYYPHADHKQDNDYRLELIRKLKEDKSLDGVAAFASSALIPEPYSSHTLNFIPLKKLFTMYAQSRAAIYVRGLHDCLSFKLGQYLALGMPIVGQQIFLDNRFARSIPNFEAQFNCTSPDEIVRDLKGLLHDSSGRAARFSKENLDYYKSHLSPKSAAEYIFSAMDAKNNLR